MLFSRIEHVTKFLQTVYGISFWKISGPSSTLYNSPPWFCWQVINVAWNQEVLKSLSHKILQEYHNIFYNVNIQLNNFIIYWTVNHFDPSAVKIHLWYFAACGRAVAVIGNVVSHRHTCCVTLKQYINLLTENFLFEDIRGFNIWNISLMFLFFNKNAHVFLNI